MLLINIVFLIWSLTNYGHTDGIGYLYRGSCATVNQMSTGVHVVINILSTILLSGSNFCRFFQNRKFIIRLIRFTGMQRLSAPSRADLDAAHSKSIWLDIGIPSVKNLGYIPWRRAMLWWLLGLSSIPLHLL